MTADEDPLNHIGLLLSTSAASLRRSLQDGANHGYRPGEWREHSIMEHLDHAEAHTRVAVRLNSRENTVECLDIASQRAELLEHIDHGMARLAMARAQLRQEDRKDNPEA